MAEPAHRSDPGADDEVAARVASSDAEVLSLATSLYRDEMRRAMSWRDRIDRTTNWAVVLTATLLTWAFSRTDNPHYVILIAIGVVTLLMVVEARRYRFYDVWRARLRLIEQNIFASLFDGSAGEQREWRELLSEDLRQPSFKMPWIEAVQRRLRRIYGPLVVALLLSWALRITTFEPGPFDLAEDAAVGDIPGAVTVTIVALFALALGIVGLLPVERRAPGSVEEDDGDGATWDD